MMRFQRAFSLHPLARAIALTSASSLLINQALAQEDAEDKLQIEEVIVTATKRSVDMQDLPQSIQAFSTEDRITFIFDYVPPSHLHHFSLEQKD